MNGVTLDVLEYYHRYFRDGLEDLSSSSPPVVHDDGNSPGYPTDAATRPLRELVAARYPGLQADDILLSNGASEALAAAALAFVSEGTEVLVDRGTYPSFVDVAKRLGARLLDADDGRARRPSVAVRNNPTVPDGRLLDLEAELREWEAAGTTVVVDEVHLNLTEHGALSAASLSRSAVSIGDLSKPLGLGGLRIGWAATRNVAARAELERTIHLLSGGPSLPAIEHATAAMAEFEARYASAALLARSNAEEVQSLLRGAGWRISVPDSGWTALAIPPDGVAVPDAAILAREGLFLVPAGCFGLTRGFRVSLFAPPDAIRRLLSVCQPPRGTALVVLAKAPLPGVAKTRLAAAVGAEDAAALAHAFLCDTLEMARSTADELVVAFAPAASRPAFERLAPGWRLVAQPDADFGDRLVAALEAALAAGRRAVLIGTDTPDLPAGVVREAFERLDRCDVVVGPASDGGFYLVGLKQSHAGLFDEIEWSTASVCGRLLDNAGGLGLSVSLLPEWSDIDDLDSLAQAGGRTTRSGRAPRTRLAIEALELGVSHGA